MPYLLSQSPFIYSLINLFYKYFMTETLEQNPSNPLQLSLTQGKSKQMTILCPLCGIRFNPSKGNICNTCIMSSTDITKKIEKEGVLTFCRDCKRYQRPPWVYCQRQSKELLSVCLNKVKGLGKLKLISADFIWTEPHSRRIKLKLTVAEDINNTTELSQTTIVQFYEEYFQCPDCKKLYTPHKWESVVQVRQHVDHKKTFLHLQQQILQNKAHEHIMKVIQQDDGVNFFFKQNMYAQRMVQFLSSILPTKVKFSKQYISQDMKNHTAVFNFTHSVEIPKICKDDIVLIHPKLSKMLGGCGLMLLCYKVTTYMHMIDLSNYRTLTISKQQYDLFEHKFDILPLSKFKTEFQILDSQPINKQNPNQTISNLLDHRLYQTVITRTTHPQELTVKCHLGELQPGQIVEGYDLRYLQYNDYMNNYPGVPEVVLVRRAKDPEKKKKRQQKVKRLSDEGIVVEEEEKKKKGRMDKNEEFEEFLDEYEEKGAGEVAGDTPKLEQILERVEKEEQKGVEKGEEEKKQEEGKGGQEKGEQTQEAKN